MRWYAVQKSLFGDTYFGHQTIRQYEVALPRGVYRECLEIHGNQKPMGAHRIGLAVSERRADTCTDDKEFFAKTLSRYETFDHFVNDWLVYQDSTLWMSHFKPQMHYICEFDGSVAMDLYHKIV